MKKTAVPYSEMTIKEAQELKKAGVSLSPQGDGKIIELGIEGLEEEA